GWREGGLGRRMMERVLEWMRARSFAKAELAVFATNDRARRLYESLGFVEEGVRRRHVRIRGEFVDEVLMGLWFGPEPGSAAPGGDSKSPTHAGATTVNLHINAKDVDKLWNQALNAGAKPTLPLENQFWGERYGKLQDPFGHIWSVSMAVKMSEQEKESKRQAAFAMMGGGEASGSEKSWT